MEVKFKVLFQGIITGYEWLSPTGWMHSGAEQIDWQPGTFSPPIYPKDFVYQRRKLIRVTKQGKEIYAI
jgi:hypothetical protein